MPLPNIGPRGCARRCVRQSARHRRTDRPSPTRISLPNLSPRSCIRQRADGGGLGRQRRTGRPSQTRIFRGRAADLFGGGRCPAADQLDTACKSNGLPNKHHNSVGARRRGGARMSAFAPRPATRAATKAAPRLATRPATKWRFRPRPATRARRWLARHGHTREIN